MSIGRGEIVRRRALESEAVVAEPALEAKLNAVEHELRRVAQVVVPHDQRIADHDLALAQDPVGDRQLLARLLGIEFEPGDPQHAGAIAADRKPRALR
jgi:hypothetical protein